MDNQAHVAFPAGYFARHCQNEYARPMEALCREFLQNSIDAGASYVAFTTADDHLTVRDDGRGITRERMVEALLTMGGTDKADGSIGGFGNAKVALLFAHKAYQIRTLNTVVDGQVLSYRMRDLGPGELPVVGAEFTIYPAEEWGYETASFARTLYDYLSTCDLRVRVLLNGHVCPTGANGRRIDLEFPYGRVLARRLPEGMSSEYLFVRVNGLTMYREYVQATDRQVIIELAGDTRSMFTSNRDGLRSPFRNAVNDIRHAIEVDKKSFDRKRDIHVLYEGSLQRYYAHAQEAVSVLVRHMPEAVAREVMAEAARVFHANPDAPAAMQAALAQRGCSSCLAPEEMAQVGAVLARAKQLGEFDTDFIISIENTDYREPPVRYRPGRMLRRHERLAKLWRHCIGLVLSAAGESLNYRIGFVLDPEKHAYFKGNQERGDVLINPDTFPSDQAPRDRFFRCLQLAAHELAHRRFTWHDECFVLESERLFRAALVKMESVPAEMRKAARTSL